MQSEQRPRIGTPPSVEDIARLAWLDNRREWWGEQEKAAQIGVHRRTLTRWRKRSDYQAARLAAEMAARDANPIEAALHELDDATWEKYLAYGPEVLPEHLRDVLP